MKYFANIWKEQPKLSAGFIFLTLMVNGDMRKNILTSLCLPPKYIFCFKKLDQAQRLQEQGNH